MLMIFLYNQISNQNKVTISLLLVVLDFEVFLYLELNVCKSLWCSIIKWILFLQVFLMKKRADYDVGKMI